MFLFELQDWAALSEEAGYSAVKLAQLCNVSRRHLQREFRRKVGCGPQEWLDARRMLVATGMLMQGESVKEVAYKLGFKQPTHFSRNFRLCHQVSPSKFFRRRSCSAGEESKKCR
jgi:AraC family transcriptional regulator